MASEDMGKKWPAEEGNSYLIIILYERTDEEVYSECEKILKICEENGSIEVLIGERKEEQDRILDIRSHIYEVLKSDMFEELDVAVPPAAVDGFMRGLKEISDEHRTDLYPYGHIGDGNLHVHIMKDAISDFEQIKREIYELGIELGGSITGEHGIGKMHKEDMKMQIDVVQIDLMRNIKKVFDPNGILNPEAVV